MSKIYTINDSKKKISKFVFKLQKQTTVPHWSLANQNIIYFLALSKEPVLGSRQKKLKTIIKLASKFHATDLIICLVGFLLAFRLWRFAKKKKKDNKNYKKVFFGFGARAEEYMFKIFTLNTHPPVLRINTSDLSNIGLAGCPSFSEIILNVINHSFGHTKKLRIAVSEISSNILDFLLTASINIADYSFYSAYWKMVKHNGTEEINFIVPDIASFAAVDAKIRAIFFQHGLLCLPILMPQFDYMEILTQDEQSYYQYIFPKWNISKKKSIYKNYSIKSNVILILSANTSNRASQLLPFTQWAINEGFQIVIRPTPDATSTELKLLNELLPDFLLDDIKFSFEESMEKWNPIAVVDWTSTVLAVSLLNYNCLPISLYNQDIGEPLLEKPYHKFFELLIYSMLERCLFWLKESDLIKQVLKSDIEYNKQIKKLTADSNAFVESLKEDHICVIHRHPFN